MEERTRLFNQLQGLQVGAPAALRERIGGNGARLADRLSRMRDRPDAQLHEQTMLTILRDLAKRARQLDAQASQYRCQITELVRELHPTLMDEPGVGPISAAKLLVLAPVRFPKRGRIRVVMAPRASRRHPARPSATGSPAAVTAKPTTRSTRSL